MTRKRRVYCSELSQRAMEEMHGSADPVGMWILLEYQPVWRRKATQDNDLEADTRRWFSRQVKKFSDQGIKARLQFIRQPERHSQDLRLFLAMVGKSLEIRLANYRALHDLDLTSLTEDIGAQVKAPVFFVCTNGQRDLCCARFGLPTYAALRKIAGERVWQTTHLGGHRFAPNVLTLPSGLLCGRVRTEEAAAFVTVVEMGEYPRRWCRGRSFYAPEVQAAEAFLAQREPKLTRFDGLALRSVEQETDDSCRVGIETLQGMRWVILKRSAQFREIRASCADETTRCVRSFELLGIESGPVVNTTGGEAGGEG